jgi:hypothetical protein
MTQPFQGDFAECLRGSLCHTFLPRVAVGLRKQLLPLRRLE